jgi:hypothetical protein
MQNTRVRNLFSTVLGAGVVAGGLMLSSCEDEFTEQDAIKAQQETLIALSDREDSLNRIGATIDYTVTVAAAGQSNTGRTSAQSSAEGAEVTLVQGGKTYTETAGKGGAATFTGLSRGQAVVTVEVADHTTVTYTTTLGFDASGTGGKEDYNVGTLIPVFPTTVEAGATEIKGKAWAELDATNDMPEAAKGAVVRGTLDVRTVLSSYRQNSGSYGKVETATYEGFSKEATVDENGDYTLIMPNGKGSSGTGFAPTVKFMPFVATQKYAEVKDGMIMEVEKEVIFGGANTPNPSNNHISDETPGIYVEIAAPDAKPEGFAVEPEMVSQYIDEGYVRVIEGGTGYTDGEVFELSADKDGNKGQLTVFANDGDGGDGAITGYSYNANGALYAEKPTITPGANVTGTGAKLDIEFINNYKVKITNPGSGYWTSPKVSVVIADDEGTQYGLPSILTYEDEGYNRDIMTIEDGKVGQKDGYVRARFDGDLIISSMITPTFNIENPVVKQAMIDPSLITITDGRISDEGIRNDNYWNNGGFFIESSRSQPMFEGGAGYLTQPKVTFKSAAGAGTGAEGLALIEDGMVVGIIITKAGSGYKTEANKEVHDELSNSQSFQTYGTNGDGELTPGASNVGINFSYGTGQLQ